MKPLPPRIARLSFLWAGDRWLGVSMVALVVYYIVQPGIFEGKHSGDGLHAFNYLKAIVYHHTLDMQEVLPEFKKYIGVNPVTHHMPNRNPIGTVPFWTPFYLLACVIAGIVKLVSGVALKTNSALHAWLCGLGSLAVVLWGLRQLFVLLERRYGVFAARLGAIASVWATAIAWYAVTQPLYQHGVVFGMSAAFVEYWERAVDDPSPRRMALLGVWGGYLAAIRGQEILFLLLPASDIVRGLVLPGRRALWLRSGVAAALASLVGVLPQLLVWFYYFGFNKPHLEPLRPYEPFVLSALFSTRAGLFPWTPVVYASVIGLLGWGWRSRERRLVAPLALAFALNVYVVACGWLVHGAYGFGARRLSDGAVLFAIGIALFAHAIEARLRLRRWLVVFVEFCVVYNLAAMELQRLHLTSSSGASTRRVSDYLRQVARGRDVGAALGRPFDWIGHPFVQPAGWLFGAWYRVRPSMFDIVVGQAFLERDGAWLGLIDPTKLLPFDREHEGFVAEGLAQPMPPAASKQAALVDGRVRLLMSFFAKEKIGVRLVGDLREGPTSLLWNGTPIPVLRGPDGFRAEVPAVVAKAGVNVVVIDVPVGSRLTKLELDSYSVPTR